MRSWPPPMREDRFSVGDVIWWHIPTVMDVCRTWAPDITKPVTVVAVRDIANSGHSQLVRISPNYCPWDNEFNGAWFLPVGIQSHNDPAFRDRPDVVALREWQASQEDGRP